MIHAGQVGAWVGGTRREYTNITSIGQSLGSSTNKFTGIAQGPNGKMYLAPRGYGYIVELDPLTGEWRNMGPPKTSAVDIALGPDGCMYLAPISGQRNVVRFDPESNTADVVYTLPTAATYGSGGIAQGLNGKMYLAPGHSTHIVEIDPWTGQAEVIGEPFGYVGDDLFVGIALGPDGCMYMAPRKHTHVVRVDPLARTWENVGYAMNADLRKFSGIAQGPNGKMYLAPGSNLGPADGFILEYDTYTGVLRKTGAYLNGAFWGIAQGPNGKMYLAPRGYDYIVELDPLTSQWRNMTEKKFNTYREFAGIALGPDGCMYMAPDTNAFIHRIS